MCVYIYIYIYIYIISISTYIFCAVASTSLLQAAMFIGPSSSGGLGSPDEDGVINMAARNRLVEIVICSSLLLSTLFYIAKRILSIYKYIYIYYNT